MLGTVGLVRRWDQRLDVGDPDGEPEDTAMRDPLSSRSFGSSILSIFGEGDSVEQLALRVDKATKQFNKASERFGDSTQAWSKSVRRKYDKKTRLELRVGNKKVSCAACVS